MIRDPRAGYKTSVVVAEVLDDEGDVEAVDTFHWSGRKDLALFPKPVTAKLWVPGRRMDKRTGRSVPATREDPAWHVDPSRPGKRTTVYEVPVDQAEQLMQQIKAGARNGTSRQPGTGAA